MLTIRRRLVRTGRLCLLYNFGTGVVYILSPCESCLPKEGSEAVRQKGVVKDSRVSRGQCGVCTGY